KHLGQSSDEAESATPDPGASSDLICVVCDKDFKTTAQKLNHEKSKKHLKAVREARREMLREERQMAKEQQQSTPLVDIDDAAHESEESASQVSDGAAEEDALAQMIRDLTMAQASSGKKNKRKKRATPAAVPVADSEPKPKSELEPEPSTDQEQMLSSEASS
ncbi:hypothetical protein IWW50_003949, partial [Coemansia erecta]